MKKSAADYVQEIGDMTTMLIKAGNSDTDALGSVLLTKMSSVLERLDTLEAVLNAVVSVASNISSTLNKTVQLVRDRKEIEQMLAKGLDVNTSAESALKWVLYQRDVL